MEWHNLLRTHATVLLLSLLFMVPLVLIGASGPVDSWLWTYAHAIGMSYLIVIASLLGLK